jgi:hypothetical protein
MASDLEGAQVQQVERLMGIVKFSDIRDPLLASQDARITGQSSPGRRSSPMPLTMHNLAARSPQRDIESESGKFVMLAAKTAVFR